MSASEGAELIQPQSAQTEPTQQVEVKEHSTNEGTPQAANDDAFGAHAEDSQHADESESEAAETLQAVDGGEPPAKPKEAFVQPVDVVAEDFPVAMPVLIETIERRDMERLESVFGGVEGFAKIVQSDAKSGIRTASVERRVEVFGLNVLNKKEPVTFFEMLKDAFADRVIQILCGAAIISIIFGLFLPNPHTGETEPATGWIEGTAIVISILVVTLTGAIQNYKKAKKFEELEAEQSVRPVSVLRDGQRTTVDTSQLAVGDVLILTTGMEMPCDALFIDGSGLKTNESPITGEPDLVEKGPAKDMFLVSGTSIEEGTGEVLVAAIGMSSFKGQMKQALEQESGETPLQEHLTNLGDKIGQLGLVGAVLLLVALTLKEVILIAQDERDANASQFLSFVIIAVTLIAVAIPEGLPLAVTISLAFSMSAMAEQQCMVRVLASCETMGAATAVCSDKTGTLTTNRMTAVQAILAELEFVLRGYGIIPRTQNTAEYDRDAMQTIDAPADVVDRFCFALSVNSTASEETDKEGALVWKGNPTEAGLLGLVQRLGRDYKELRSVVTAADKKQFSFSSLKKRMTTFVRRDGQITAYTKGASETILSQCTHYVTATGTTEALDEVRRERFMAVILDMANQGNRTIGVAYADCDAAAGLPEEEADNLPYVFLCVVGIQDPIRMEVPDAVASCQSAHLSVRMVTGDNINTAMAISKKCGIYNPDEGHVAMTGPEFREMFRTEKDRLIDLLPDLRVLARSSPNDKYVLVGLLQDELGEVVGVTGDGTNDAPALKLADVGFAMNTGTDIARGAADMVLLDDNFATVVTAIKWGRSVNDNIKKFLQYQLAINLAGVGLTIVGSLASHSSKEPIAPVQLLWLNLIMDTLAALALATERPEEACLTRQPVFKQARLITNKMVTFICVHGGYQLLIVLLILFLGHKWFETSESDESCTEVGGQQNDGYCQQGRTHSTILFNTFIWFQIFNVFNARKIYGEINPFEGLFERSRVMLAVFLLVIGLQVFAVEVGGDALSTTGLSWQHWLICIGFGFTEWIIGLIVRLLPVQNYIPTKEEIIAARKEEKKAEEERKAQEEKDQSTADPDQPPGQRRPSQPNEEMHRRRSVVSNSDPSLKRSMSIRKAH